MTWHLTIPRYSSFWLIGITIVAPKRPTQAAFNCQNLTVHDTHFEPTVEMLLGQIPLSVSINRDGFHALRGKKLKAKLWEKPAFPLIFLPLLSFSFSATTTLASIATNNLAAGFSSDSSTTSYRLHQSTTFMYGITTANVFLFVVNLSSISTTSSNQHQSSTSPPLMSPPAGPLATTPYSR